MLHPFRLFDWNLAQYINYWLKTLFAKFRLYKKKHTFYLFYIIQSRRKPYWNKKDLCTPLLLPEELIVQILCTATLINCSAEL